MSLVDVSDHRGGGKRVWTEEQSQCVVTVTFSVGLKLHLYTHTHTQQVKCQKKKLCVLCSYLLNSGRPALLYFNYDHTSDGQTQMFENLQSTAALLSWNDVKAITWRGHKMFDNICSGKSFFTVRTKSRTNRMNVYITNVNIAGFWLAACRHVLQITLGNTS